MSDIVERRDAEIERLRADNKALSFQLDLTIANLSRNEAEIERLRTVNANLEAEVKRLQLMQRFFEELSRAAIAKSEEK
jgi:cell division protein FtsB